MPITDREKWMIDNYITNVPEYKDIDEDDIDYLLDLEFELAREREMDNDL